MLSYLGQHPQVKLPTEKEINFYGHPWPYGTNKHMKTLGAFTFTYLKHFKLSSPFEKDIKVYGEASPDYFVSTRNVIIDFFGVVVDGELRISRENLKSKRNNVKNAFCFGQILRCFRISFDSHHR